MFTINQKTTLKQAINYFGSINQKIKAIEEFSELTKELCKGINKIGKPNYDLIDEIADCEIMLEQIKMIYKCHDQVEGHKETKIVRLFNRMNENGNQ